MPHFFFDKKELKALINLVLLQGEPDSDEGIALCRAIADKDFEALGKMIDELL